MSVSGEGFREAVEGLEHGASTGETGAPAGAPADAAAHPSVSALRERFADAVEHHVVTAGDEHVVYIARELVYDVLAWLMDDGSQLYDYLADVTAVDYGGGRPLELVYQLWSMRHRRALRVKAVLPLTNLTAKSVVPLWRTADWLEREVFDLFGIQFTGHPDMRRILMPENYAEGHPLRKDFPLRGRFSRAEQTRRALSMGIDDFYTPEELALAGREAEAEAKAKAEEGV